MTLVSIGLKVLIRPKMTPRPMQATLKQPRQPSCLWQLSSFAGSPSPISALSVFSTVTRTGTHIRVKFSMCCWCLATLTRLWILFCSLSATGNSNPRTREYLLWSNAAVQECGLDPLPRWVPFRLMSLKLITKMFACKQSELKVQRQTYPDETARQRNKTEAFKGEFKWKKKIN